MSHTNIQHRRTHNLLLISKLLSQRDAASPFTLVLDSLEQTAKPVVREYIRRANAAKTQVVFLGFETFKPPDGVDVFVPCYNKTAGEIGQEISRAIQGAAAAAAPRAKRHHLLLFDSLHTLCCAFSRADSSFNLTQFLSELIAPVPASASSSQTTTSLVAVYHTDIPLPLAVRGRMYHPSPLSLLSYLATTVLTVHSLPGLLAGKAAQERSLAPPVYGLEEGKEGVVVGLKPLRYTRHLHPEHKGVVLELEHRRRSGRGVREWYFLPTSTQVSQKVASGVSKESVILLDDHPLFKPKKVEDEDAAGEALAGLSFELGLTERQKAEREGVVLPYFDAQRDGGGAGPGEGGRILYDMGVEDDFDEEEDEI